MAINTSNFFTRVGHAFYGADRINTSVGTARTDFKALFDSFNNDSIDQKKAITHGPAKLDGFASSASSMISTSVTSMAQKLLIVDAEVTTASAAVRALIAKMIDDADSVDASAVGASLVYGGSNTGDGKAVTSTKRGDGLENEHLFAEDVEFTSNASGTFSFKGEKAQPSRLAYNWPLGSGSAGARSPVTNGFVTNGDVNAADTVATDLPSGWSSAVGSAGTTYGFDSTGSQTVALSGSPTTGWYQIIHEAETTTAISIGDSASAVQSVIRSGLTGFGNITVVRSGTTPNWIYTITLTDVVSPSAFTINNQTDATVTPAVVAAGTDLAFQFTSNGAELTQIEQDVTNSLLPETQYAVQVICNLSAADATGVMTVDLVDSMSGTVIQDAQAVNNTFTIAGASMLSTYVVFTGVFRTPSVLPSTAYLRIRISTAFVSTRKIGFRRIGMAAMRSIYTGGPSVVVFQGLTAWANYDTITATMTNDAAGQLHEWMNRSFGLREANLLIPSNAAGGETILDSLIA
jgi:hypothetical protein